MGKTKYETNIEPNLDKVKEWAEQGMTHKEIAKHLDVSYSRFKDYMQEHSALSSALKKALDLNVEKVENSLLTNACGGVVSLRKPIKCKTKLYKEGKVVKEEEVIRIVEEEVFIKPDTIAQMYWLNNRAPDRWRAKPVEENANSGGDVIIVDDINGEGAEYADQETDIE